MRHLATKYDYIDSKRMAVFGWSYGGFLSTHIAIRDQGKTFKCAIAVSPVVDFMLYDSAYTERYMGIPLENQGAYNESQLLNKAAHLKNVKYVLAHGEADGPADHLGYRGLLGCSPQALRYDGTVEMCLGRRYEEIQSLGSFPESRGDDTVER
ncbi:unnamed protein product [Heligmosomoides polygyrus]|uniref:Peptidase_S9 domain-containing protein n=1 Tax=Heligmosomoides polygyrus TaxID=6339 RepID=A0A183GJB7_HELPZ|nr:unnamed protein product [Heligmosomoides polygyrus]